MTSAMGADQRVLNVTIVFAEMWWLIHSRYLVLRRLNHPRARISNEMIAVVADINGMMPIERYVAIVITEPAMAETRQ